MLIKKDEQHYVPKGWGYERWIYNEGYCGKILFFNKGKQCSLHYHAIKDEVLYLQSGKITVIYRSDAVDRTVDLEPGDAFHVYPGLVHRMIAHEDSYIIEFSTHHEDSDSHRIEKGD